MFVFLFTSLSKLPMFGCLLMSRSTNHADFEGRENMKSREFIATSLRVIVLGWAH